MGTMNVKSYVCLKTFKPGFGCQAIHIGELVQVEMFCAEFQIVKASQFIPYGLGISLNDLATYFQGVN